jgi:hypothetical protein
MGSGSGGWQGDMTTSIVAHQPVGGFGLVTWAQCSRDGVRGRRGGVPRQGAHVEVEWRRARRCQVGAALGIQTEPMSAASRMAKKTSAARQASGREVRVLLRQAHSPLLGRISHPPPSPSPGRRRWSRRRGCTSRSADGIDAKPACAPPPSARPRTATNLMWLCLQADSFGRGGREGDMWGAAGPVLLPCARVRSQLFIPLGLVWLQGLIKPCIYLKSKLNNRSWF